jgi:hypothetical protein
MGSAIAGRQSLCAAAIQFQSATKPEPDNPDGNIRIGTGNA